MTHNKAPLQVKVSCYAGYRADERPERFFIGEHGYEVSEIIDQWYGPDYRYFKLRTEDGGIYILRHSEKNDCWDLTLFDSDSSHSKVPLHFKPENKRPC